MIKIVLSLSESSKQEILDFADHKCQCRSGHQCITIVNKSSQFITDSNNELFSPDNVKVFCTPCIRKRHHYHLTLPVDRDDAKYNFGNK